MDSRGIRTRLGNALYHGYEWIGQTVAGDLWEASESDGTGLGKMIHKASTRAKVDPRHIAWLRFLHQYIVYIEDASFIQQLEFNDALAGHDTTGVFGIFGKKNPRNLFAQPTESHQWRVGRSAFVNHLYMLKALKKMTDPMHKIIDLYEKEITELKGEMEDIEDFTTRFTMDIIGKTQLAIEKFPIKQQREFSRIINNVTTLIANPLHSIEAILPSSIRSLKACLRSSQKTKSLEELMQPARDILLDVIKQNEESILGTNNWLRDVSLQQIWCRKKAEERGLKEEEKWPDDVAKDKWFYEKACKADWFKAIENEEWPKALEGRSKEIIDILYSPAMIDDAALFLVVGHETSAKFFHYTLTLLADPAHKSIVQRLRDEVTTYLQEEKKSPEQLTVDDLQKLPYCQAIAFEGLRLFPPVPLLKGQLTKDITFAEIGLCAHQSDYKEKMKKRNKAMDITLRKGSYVFISPLEFHHSKIYDNADAFDPKRFIDKKTGLLKKPDSTMWIPFGDNQKRNCPGSKFAQLEVLLALIRFFMKFDFLMDDKDRYTVTPKFTLQPGKQGIRAKVMPREEKGQEYEHVSPLSR